MITKQSIRRRVAALMIDFGVKGYCVRVSSSTGTAWAHCDYERKEIVMHPRLLLCDWVFINQIALHEVAHALAGPKAGHGSTWLKTARGMGYRLGVKVPYVERVAGEHQWVAVCQTGQHSAIRYQKTAEDGELLCRPCHDSGAGNVGVFWDRL